MIAVLLAAGISSRLRPLTDHCPKSLLPVGGTPLLERTLRALQCAGLTRCVIVTGYHAGQVEQFVEGLRLQLEVRFVLNPHFASTNNNTSLWLAGPEVRGSAMLLLDADILFEGALLGALRSDPHPTALIMRRSRTLGQEEIKVSLDPSGRVTRIGKDVPPAQAAGESIGIEKFSAPDAARLFDILERRRVHNEFYEASFQELIDGGCALFAVDSGSAACMEIDTPEDLAAADALARTMTP